MSLSLQSFVPSLPGAEPVGFAMSNEATAKTEGSNALGAFGAILDALVKDIPIVGPLLAEAIPDGETTAPAIEPLLTAIEPAETEQPVDFKKLAAELGDLLAELQAALDAGEDPNPALLDKLDAALAALGLTETPTAPAAPTTENPLDQLGALLTRIVQRFTDNGKDVPGKLAEIATALTNPALAPAIAAKLGVEAGAAIAAEIAKLFPDAPKPAPPPQQFALPELKAPVITTADEKAAKTPPRGDATEIELKVKPAAQPDTPRPVDPAPKAQPAVAQAAHQPEPRQQQTQTPQLVAIHAAPATVRAMHAAYQAQPTPQQINIPQLAFDIVRHVQAGQSRFEIRLDPPELGRIDVKLDIDTGGALNARLTVERSETLDLLQRDQRQLERALQQAGLDANKTNLEFSLKQQQNPFDRQQGNPQQTWHASRDEPAAPKGETPALPVHLYRATVSPGGVNIFV